MPDIAHALQAQVRDAIARRAPLCIRGGGSKDFYGRAPRGEPLETGGHRGVLQHAATELVLTARAGTPLRDIEALLAEQKQMLPFEPPRFGAHDTLGGAIACGLSGPARPFAGAARDAMLGATVLTGKGEILKFGGEVMKNVAGFDVARLMAGALGTLGVLLDLSLKVLPCPERVATRVFEMSADSALRTLAGWGVRPLPLSAALHDGRRLYIRLAGSEIGLRAACQDLGGEPLPDDDAFWSAVRDQRHPFFRDAERLWRLSVPPATPPLPLAGETLIDWAGAQRWLKSAAPADEIRHVAAACGGHATLFRGRRGDEDAFQPLAPPLAALHRRLKASFDPHGILNPGRLYADF